MAKTIGQWGSYCPLCLPGGQVTIINRLPLRRLRSTHMALDILIDSSLRVKWFPPSLASIKACLVSWKITSSGQYSQRLSTSLFFYQHSRLCAIQTGRRAIQSWSSGHLVERLVLITFMPLTIGNHYGALVVHFLFACMLTVATMRGHDCETPTLPQKGQLVGLYAHL